MRDRLGGKKCTHVVAFVLAAACGGDDTEGEAGTEAGTGGQTGTDAVSTVGAMESRDDDGGSEGPGPDPGDDGPAGSSEDGSPPPPGDAAAGISVLGVRVNQAVDIDLVRDGLPTTDAQRVAPIIGGRAALVRVEYALAPDFVARPLTARLWLQQSDATNDVYEDTRDVSGPGDMLALGGTFTWSVDAEDIDGETEFRVEILEVEGADPLPGDTSGWAVPADGFAAVDAWGDPMVLDVMVVPFSCNGFGSVEITPEDLADFEAYIFNTYPVQELNLEVHDVVPSGSCSEFDAAEFDLPDLRQSEGAPPWVYYGGLLPGGGGGYSIAIEGGDQMDFRRTFANHTWRWYGLTFDLFAHELGHNHGRAHSFEDGAYPGDSSGSCGSRSTIGWGIVNGDMPNSAFSNDIELGIGWIDPHERLLPPTDATCDGLPNANEGNLNDFMSYAYPYWVSAYTYAALAERVRLISSWRGAAAPPNPQTFHRVIVDPEGYVTLTERSGSATIGAADGVARCGDRETPVRVGHAVGERFGAGHNAQVHDYLTFEFDAELPLPCVVEAAGHSIVVDETARRRSMTH